ncbi:hypothetical protein PILCRDRAFT_830470 [Piloderma croceum F 1598]|uniref:Uncharacterized protein n=1 Tax=Piloderma croceum (strain F 1598) TaxID=765440 RepID=A0A0C3ET19_PILCF|nr:hypothetical protein PILCRDRAFT_830470 [Piloderma croceum F 1598]
MRSGIDSDSVRTQLMMMTSKSIKIIHAGAKSYGAAHDARHPPTGTSKKSLQNSR